MQSSYLMSRWGDRDRKRSKKYRTKTLVNQNKEMDIFKEVHKERRESQLFREIEKFGQDVEESINENNTMVKMSNKGP